MSKFLYMPILFFILDSYYKVYFLNSPPTPNPREKKKKKKIKIKKKKKKNGKSEQRSPLIKELTQTPQLKQS